ncbi:MAG TPA: bifunctional ADP-dependent NAD(P)H-hydrate dehydratase/NAD(P)H-hydrate epimerase, partial [Idiomarina baltica]|nr:bifunctional ADP-dependent NAD(P)H-hydrate dehydratase/NAD(P)H-hydrate epimerase [Idiomarina sp.]HAR57083.1 bifunctional ADP-dependent NAD(P)H-hydrate dehydratase/NAD(P)H-hydrate epimerase [Idiomarina baltica]
LIGALVAQGLAPAQALTAGVYWHAVAGEVAGSKAPRGTLASDLMPIIRKLVNGWTPE